MMTLCGTGMKWWFILVKMQSLFKPSRHEFNIFEIKYKNTWKNELLLFFFQRKLAVTAKAVWNKPNIKGEWSSNINNITLKLKDWKYTEIERLKIHWNWKIENTLKLKDWKYTEIERLKIHWNWKIENTLKFNVYFLPKPEW